MDSCPVSGYGVTFLRRNDGVGERGFTAESAEGAEEEKIHHRDRREHRGGSCIGGIVLRSFDKLRRARLRANGGGDCSGEGEDGFLPRIGVRGDVPSQE